MKFSHPVLMAALALLVCAAGTLRAQSDQAGCRDDCRAPRNVANVWYFGANAGLTFESGNPAPLTDGAINSSEGCAVACDPRSGALLFYTDGSTIWDSRNQPMKNGTGIEGHFSSTQGALIVPKPCSPAIHYVFTAGGLDTDMDDARFGLRYSIVDMRLNGGRGAVTVKNVDLLEDNTEKLTATRHRNGRDYWVVTHEWGSDAFRAYLVSPEGVSDPVISRAGAIYPKVDVPSAGWCAGQIKLSRDGSKLAAANWTGRIAELFDFDNATGAVSNAMTLDLPSRLYYGAAFSPDNSKLYVSAVEWPVAIFQFDLDNPDPATINASRAVISIPEIVQNGGSLQLGPDGRIYFARWREKTLGVITRPNEPYPACAYVDDGASLEGRTCFYGLPNFIDSDILGPCDEGPRHPSGSSGIGSNEPTSQESVLLQNRPNPFGPATEIEIVLDRAGHATLEIFTAAGERVATLIDGERAPGVHRVSWNGEKLPAGLYYYRLTAGERSETRSMVLVK